jgi:hypothetical protein
MEGEENDATKAFRRALEAIKTGLKNAGFKKTVTEIQALLDDYPVIQQPIPAQPEQGQGEKSCENCGATCSGRVRIVPKNKDVCFNWQPIPAKVDPMSGPIPVKTLAIIEGLEDQKLSKVDSPNKVDGKSACVCQIGHSTTVCKSFISSGNLYPAYCECGHHKSCHAQEKG